MLLLAVFLLQMFSPLLALGQGDESQLSSLLPPQWYAPLRHGHGREESVCRCGDCPPMVRLGKQVPLLPRYCRTAEPA